MKAQITEETFSALYKAAGDFKLVETEKNNTGENGIYYSSSLDCTLWQWYCFASGVTEFWVIDCNY
jgi:hypothetical protein